MLYFEDYSRIQKQYYHGLKTLHQKVSYPQVSISKESKGYLKPTANTFSAYFNKRGYLIYYIKRLKQTPYKYHYFYNWDNQLIRALEVRQNSNRLVGENMIKYTDSNCFIENLWEGIGSVAERTSEIHHSLQHDIQIVEKKACPMKDWYLCQKLSYDNIVEELFEIEEGKQETTVHEYNNNRQIVKTYYVDDEDESDAKYNPEEYYQSTYYGSGLLKTYEFIGKDSWTKTYGYKFNDRGHWIEKVIKLNETLQFLTERRLIYF